MKDSRVWRFAERVGLALPALPVWPLSILDAARPEPAKCSDDFDLTAIKRTSGIGAAVAAVAVIPWPALILLIIPVYLAGTAVPEALLARRETAARDEIDAELPFLAELMAVMLSAGIGMEPAFLKAVRETGGELRRYLERAAAEISMGETRARALAESAQSSPSREFKRFAAAIADADRFGMPMAPRLRTMAVEMRRARAARIREEAQKLPVKMLFPLVFLILPSFILLSAAPFIADLAG
jgi:tight adherence protein C